MPLPDISILAEFLDYNPTTGRIYWNYRDIRWFKSTRDCKIWNTKNAFNEAFTHTVTGYRTGRLLGHSYLAHKLIFKILHGTEPTEIDHIDGDRQNNKPDNLRAVTRNENMQNRKTPSSNKSGAMGVCYFKRTSRWCAYISINGKRVHLGFFKDIADAIAARQTAIQQQPEYHPNHGR